MAPNYSHPNHQKTKNFEYKFEEGQTASSDSQLVESGYYGITTGTAATAAALAALLSLKGRVDSVRINTPLGNLDIAVKHSKRLTEISGEAVVVKMPYRDPDVTKNLEIEAEVHLRDEPGIEIFGGEGIGIVTKPGLQVSVGQKAINPVPKEMIRSNLEDALPDGKGAEVTIKVPMGKDVASKTMNPRLGIIDGISILGTTGIARSMNTESFQKAKKCQLDVALAEGYHELVLVPGNIGEKMARRLLRVDADQIIQMGNLVGYMLEQIHNKDVSQIIILGHAGKLVKIAGGIFQTEHRIADGRREIVTAHAGLLGAEKELLESIYHSNTTENMINLLEENGILKDVFNSIATAIKERCLERFGLDPEVLILKMDGTPLNQNHRINLNFTKNDF
jgi:cobalt-precorrin-5B (C1)-methyltransferase